MKISKAIELLQKFQESSPNAELKMHGKDGHRKTLQDKWAKKYHCHLQNTFSTPALH